MVKPGEIQSIFLVPQDSLCPLAALQNFARVVLAGPNDLLFSWCDSHGLIQLLVKSKAIGRVNAIIKAWGWGTAFGHSFWIGGASYYLSQS